MLMQVFQVVSLAMGDWQPRPAMPPLTRRQHRELAQTLRRLPSCYRDRLPQPTLRRVTDAAATGRWEKAVELLVSALHSRAARVTAAERNELRAIVTALALPAERVDALPLR